MHTAGHLLLLDEERDSSYTNKIFLHITLNMFYYLRYSDRSTFEQLLDVVQIFKVISGSRSSCGNLPTDPYGPPVALYSSIKFPALDSISCTVMSTVPPPQSTTIYRVPVKT